MPDIDQGLTFVGDNCPGGTANPRRSTRPIWAEVLLALVIAELLRSTARFVYDQWQRRYQIGRYKRGSSGPRRDRPPPSETPLPGETPSELHTPSAPPAPFGTAWEQSTLTPSPAERRVPFATRRPRGDYIPVGYEDPPPGRQVILACLSPHKLNLQNGGKLVVSFDPDPPSWSDRHRA